VRSTYHVELTQKALEPAFSREAASEVVRANLKQDRLWALLTKPHFHVDDSRIAEAKAYMAVQHAQIVALAGVPDAGPRQRAALGRLLHTVQDFYAHTNYVDLWLARSGIESPSPAVIDGLDPELLGHPDLRSGNFVLWRDFIYYIPLVKRWARRVIVRPGSHEAMNLDSPESGPRFALAYEAARQRSVDEVRRALGAVRQKGGDPAVRALTTA
jgi:hypothetical protein